MLQLPAPRTPLASKSFAPTMKHAIAFALFAAAAASTPANAAYKCTGSGCVQAADGVPLTECLQVCVGQLYQCSDGVCQPSTEGAPKDRCEMACAPPTPAPAPPIPAPIPTPAPVPPTPVPAPAGTCPGASMAGPIGMGNLNVSIHANGFNALSHFQTMIQHRPQCKVPGLTRVC